MEKWRALGFGSDAEYQADQAASERPARIRCSACGEALCARCTAHRAPDHPALLRLLRGECASRGFCECSPRQVAEHRARTAAVRQPARWWGPGALELDGAGGAFVRLALPYVALAALVGAVVWCLSP